MALTHRRRPRASHPPSRSRGRELDWSAPGRDRRNTGRGINKAADWEVSALRDVSKVYDLPYWRQVRKFKLVDFFAQALWKVTAGLDRFAEAY